MLTVPQEDLPLSRLTLCTAIGIARLELEDPDDQFAVESLEPLSSLTVSWGTEGLVGGASHSLTVGWVMGHMILSVALLWVG